MSEEVKSHRSIWEALGGRRGYKPLRSSNNDEDASNEKDAKEGHDDSSTVALELSTEVIRVIPRLQEKYPNLTGWVTFNEINEEFRHTLDIEKEVCVQDAETLSAIEKYRLTLITAVTTHEQIKPYIKQPKPMRPLGESWWKWVGLVILSVLRIILEAIGSFNSFESLTLLIFPAVAGYAMWVPAVVLTVLNALLFSTFDVQALKEGMGFSVRFPNVERLKTFHREIRLVGWLNNVIFNFEFMRKTPSQEYHAFSNVIATFNGYLANKRPSLTLKYPTSRSKKFIKYFTLCFGGLMVAAGGYFMLNAFLARTWSFLLEVPNYYVPMTVVTILVSLVFYYFTQAKNLSKLISPDLEEFAKVRNKLTHFNIKEEKSLREACDWQKGFVDAKVKKDAQSADLDISSLSSNVSADRLAENKPSSI